MPQKKFVKLGRHKVLLTQVLALALFSLAAFELAAEPIFYKGTPVFKY